MEKLTKLLLEDMKPALGVTEPGAIAFAVATAKSYVSGEVRNVKVALNSGIYKNAFTCGIPNSVNYGNLYAAALGAVAAKADKGLESLSDITREDDRRAEQLVEEGKVQVLLDHIGSEITIDAEVTTDEDCCFLSIRDAHTNIVKITKNDIVIFEKNEKLQQSENEESQIHQYRLTDLIAYVKDVEIKEIAFIREAFTMNLELLQEGMKSERAVITKYLLKQNGERVISEEFLPTAQLLCNGAIEARVLGLSRPAMSITGSGAHGIIATMPLYAYYKVYENEMEEEVLLRATALSYLITMYIKEYSGRLSAFCGCGIAAGCGMACALAFMQGADEEQIDMVIRNMASGLTGMICDGGNQGCAMKGIVALNAAVSSAELAMERISIEKIHGINGKTPEDTMKYMGMIASPGMVQTEKTIVQIMQDK